MKTRMRILGAALDLFNVRGIASVSTNHIAEAISISPGNLYYHFPNKEAIIAALFEQLFDEWDKAFTLPDDRLPILDDAIGLVRTNFAIMERYRFIYREMLALLRADEALHARYIAVRARGYAGFREIILSFTRADTALDETTITRLADLCWLISEFWLANLEIMGEPLTTATTERGLNLMIEVLRPYLPDHP